MKKRNGGYLMVDLTSTDLVERLNIAYANDKPVLVYDENNKANFYTLTSESTNYVLTGTKKIYTVNKATGEVTPSDPGSGGGSKSYIHRLSVADNLSTPSSKIDLVIVNSSPDPITSIDGVYQNAAKVIAGTYNYYAQGSVAGQLPVVGAKYEDSSCYVYYYDLPNSYIIQSVDIIGPVPSIIYTNDVVVEL